MKDSFLNKIFFGKYKPIKKLGLSPCKDVYSCINIIEQRQYALKFVSKYK